MACKSFCIFEICLIFFLLQVAKLASIQKEMSLRQQVSSLVQLTLAVMNAAHVSIPALHWYIHQLAVVQPKAQQFRVRLVELFYAGQNSSFVQKRNYV